MARILVVDDEEGTREFLAERLGIGLRTLYDKLKKIRPCRVRLT